MFSIDVHRDIARRLRRVDVLVDPRDDAEVCDRREVENALDLVNEDGWYRAGDVKFLADLIDRPTCHLVDDEDGRTACSECGCTDPCMLNARFCPDCGSRVVYEEDDDD